MNDTIIFFVLAALALIFKWLTSKGSGDAEKPKPAAPNEPIRRAPPQTEEERVRRFLEALGVPPGTQPPPSGPYPHRHAPSGGDIGSAHAAPENQAQLGAAIASRGHNARRHAAPAPRASAAAGAGLCRADASRLPRPSFLRPCLRR